MRQTTILKYKFIIKELNQAKKRLEYGMKNCDKIRLKTLSGMPAEEYLEKIKILCGGLEISITFYKSLLKTK